MLTRSAAAWAARRLGARALSSTAPPAAAAAPARRGAWLLLIPPAAAAGLCVWQLERRRWKVELLDGWEKALQADPAPLATLPPAPPPLTRVHLGGATLRPSASVRIGPRPRAGVQGTVPGAVLVTPVSVPASPAPRTALLVRGWVPLDWADGARDGDALPAGTLAVVRAPEAPSRFVPANDPPAGRWHWLDAAALARAAGLPADTLLLELVTDSDARTLPPTPQQIVGGRTADSALTYPLPRTLADVSSVSVTPATHAQYAATWGTLSAATAALAVKALRRKG